MAVFMIVRPTYRISCIICQWKNFENRSTTAKVMFKIQVCWLLRHSVMRRSQEYSLWCVWQTWRRRLSIMEHIVYWHTVHAHYKTMIDSCCCSPLQRLGWSTPICAFMSAPMGTLSAAAHPFVCPVRTITPDLKIVVKLKVDRNISCERSMVIHSVACLLYTSPSPRD